MKIPTEVYSQVVESVPIVCVDMVLHQNGKVLLVKRKYEPEKGIWWVPGGRILKNEKLGDACIRKIFQETGLKVSIKRQLPWAEYFNEKSCFENVKTGTHSIVARFLVEPEEENQDVSVDKTSSDFKWIEKIEEDLEPYVKKVIVESGVFD